MSIILVKLLTKLTTIHYDVNLASCCRVSAFFCDCNWWLVYIFGCILLILAWILYRIFPRHTAHSFSLRIYVILSSDHIVSSPGSATLVLPGESGPTLLTTAMCGDPGLLFEFRVR